MLIIGVDPGSYNTGWGIVDAGGSCLKYIDSGVIQPSRNSRLSDKLEMIYLSLEKVVKDFSPDEGSLEDVFFCKNVKSALVLGHARAAALLAMRRGGCERIIQYSPRKIKMSVVGTGGADKKQIQHMVKIILGLKKSFKTEDESDALATAICHAHNHGVVNREKMEL